jgi:hypothetical protein
LICRPSPRAGYPHFPRAIQIRQSRAAPVARANGRTPHHIPATTFRSAGSRAAQAQSCAAMRRAIRIEFIVSERPPQRRIDRRRSYPRCAESVSSCP